MVASVQNFQKCCVGGLVKYELKVDRVKEVFYGTTQQARFPAKEAYDEARRKLTNPMPNADTEMPTESGDPEKEIRAAADWGDPTVDPEEGANTNQDETVTETEAAAAEDDVGRTGTLA